MRCSIFWGSHGCDLDEDHDGQHLCRSCCDHEDAEHRAHHEAATPDMYGADGCAGTWPYYADRNMAGKTEHGLGFFRYEGPEWEFVYLPGEFDRLANLIGGASNVSRGVSS